MELSELDWAYVQERAAYFTGRGWAFDRLDQFLDGPPGVFLLLGEPGTGKTAVAAQLVLAAAGRLTSAATGPTPRQAVPVAAAYFCRAGRVDLLDAAQRLSDQLAEAIPGFAHARQATLLPQIRVGDVQVHTGDIASGGSATGIRIDLSRLQAQAQTAFVQAVTLPLKRVREAGESTQIVLLVDALDESLASQTAKELPRLLGDVEYAHLVVTARPDRRATGGLWDRAARVDLLADAPPGSDDVLEYLQRRLTPEGEPAAMTVLAQRIAEQASGNFLYAFYVIEALRSTHVLAAFDDAAARGVPLPEGGLAEVYRNFLRRELWRDDRAWSTRFGPVLAPLAVARDEGLTTEQLRLVAGRLGEEPITRTVIREVTRTARQFLDGPAPDGPFRVYHQSFADFLVDPEQNPDFLIDAAETHETIVAAYTAIDPLSWDSYARRNLALHASEVGQLDHLLEDARFLLVANFAGLLQLLPARPEPPEAGIVAVLRLAGSAAAELSPVPRARQLALAAAHLGLAELRRAFAAWVNDGWVPLWAHSLVPHQSLAGHAGSVRAVAVGRLGDRDVIVSGGDDGTVRVWDASGAPRQSLTGHAGSVRAVAVGRAGDQDVVVSGGDDGTVRVWDATGRPVIEPLVAHAEPVRAVVIGRAGERDVIVSGGDDGLRVWDAATGQILERPPHWLSDLLRERGITDIFRRRDITDVSSVKALAIGRPGGRDVIVSVCEECEVWDAARRTRICSLDTWYTGPLTAVVIGNARGRDVIVTASSDGKVALWDWDAATDWRYWEQVGEVAGPLKAVAMGQMAGRQMIVAGGADGTVWTWDVAAPEPTGSLLARQAAAVNAVAIGRAANREIIVSGGRDETVRVWDAAQGKHDGDQLPGHDSRVETVAAGAIGGRDVVVSGGDDGLHVWDATTGRAIRDLEPFWRVSGVKAVAIAWSGHSNRNLILIAIHKGEIRAHTGNRNELRGRPKTVAAAREPSEAIVTSGRDGVWAWNTQTPQRTFPGAVFVTPVAVGQIGGRDVVVSGHEDRMLRIWNLETPRTPHLADLLAGNLADRIADDRLEAAKLRPGPVASLATLDARMTAVAIGKIDGREVIVTGHADGSVRVWDPAAKRLKDRLTGHLRPVTAVAAGRAGGRDLIVSGSTDRKVCVWDVAADRLETLEMLDVVTGLAVNANHLAVASGIAVAVFSVPLPALAATCA